MTYNFDPERWFEIESDALARSFREGRLDRIAYETPLDSLQQRLDALWARLDGSYCLPGKDAS